MNNEAMNTENAQNAQNLTEKAAAVLKARLPKLSEATLNFEKRTGNFFRAVAVQQEDGSEKISRLVIADEDLNPTPEMAAEMEVKRAAALVTSIDSRREKVAALVEEARAALEEAENAAAALEADFEKAAALVEGYELPEKVGRVTQSATIAKQTAEIDRLRAMLAAAGIDPDSLDA